MMEEVNENESPGDETLSGFTSTEANARNPQPLSEEASRKVNGIHQFLALKPCDLSLFFFDEDLLRFHRQSFFIP